LRSSKCRATGVTPFEAVWGGRAEEARHNLRKYEAEREKGQEKKNKTTSETDSADVSPSRTRKTTRRVRRARNESSEPMRDVYVRHFRRKAWEPRWKRARVRNESTTAVVLETGQRVSKRDVKRKKKVTGRFRGEVLGVPWHERLGNPSRRGRSV
jgi:hypothetical protein